MINEEITDKIKLSFCPKTNLLQFTARGDMKLIDFKKMIKIMETFSNKIYRIKVLLDLRITKASYIVGQQLNLIKPFKESIRNFSSIRIADIVDSPIETAYAVLFKKQVQNISNLQFEVFSTKEAALNWLNMQY